MHKVHQEPCDSERRQRQGARRSEKFYRNDSPVIFELPKSETNIKTDITGDITSAKLGKRRSAATSRYSSGSHRVTRCTINARKVVLGIAVCNFWGNVCIRGATSPVDTKVWTLRRRNFVSDSRILRDDVSLKFSTVSSHSSLKRDWQHLICNK